MNKKWDVNVFSSFDCYFNFVTTNKVNFHFLDEFFSISILDDKISVDKNFKFIHKSPLSKAFHFFNS